MNPFFELKDLAGDSLELKRDTLMRMTYICITENTSHSKIIAGVMYDKGRLEKLRDALNERIKEIE